MKVLFSIFIWFFATYVGQAQVPVCPKNMIINQLEYERKLFEARYNASVSVGLPDKAKEAADSIQQVDRNIAIEYFKQGVGMFRLTQNGDCLSVAYRIITGVNIRIVKVAEDEFSVYSGTVLVSPNNSLENLVTLLKLNVGIPSFP